MALAEATEEEVLTELWASFASLLRTYTAAHGLNGREQAMVEYSVNSITVRVATRWLSLKRTIDHVAWQRETGAEGALVLLISGLMESRDGSEGELESREMDLVAEQMACALMQ